MRPGDQPARGRRSRGGLRVGLVALCAGALLAGCGDTGTSTSRADVLTTGPEPGAELATTPTTPAGPSPAAPTPAATDDAKKRDDADRRPSDRGASQGKGPGKRDADESNMGPTPSPAPASAGRTPEPTIAPPATLAPKASSDPFDLAFARQMGSHQFAESLIARVGETRGQDADVRAFASRTEKAVSESFNTLTFWADGLGIVPASGLEPRVAAADMRTLGAPVDRINASRAVVKGAVVPFEGVPDDAFDETFVATMIEHLENGLTIGTGTIKASGSARFRRLAAQLARRQRDDIRELRAIRRAW
ncbi:MAG: DUF305 domain-containing protein [Solirubrobacteraceae bacterium]|nr:DUF305 domain-containing protein [Solirubrobacteraceae bacterium]